MYIYTQIVIKLRIKSFNQKKSILSFLRYCRPVTQHVSLFTLAVRKSMNQVQCLIAIISSSLAPDNVTFK